MNVKKIRQCMSFFLAAVLLFKSVPVEPILALNSERDFEAQTVADELDAAFQEGEMSVELDNWCVDDEIEDAVDKTEDDVVDDDDEIEDAVDKTEDDVVDDDEIEDAVTDNDVDDVGRAIASSSAPFGAHGRFQDPETGTWWRVLEPATPANGEKALIITEFIHGLRYHSNSGFTLFQSSDAQNNIRNWFNNTGANAAVGSTLRGMAMNYEFQNASGGAIARTSTAAGVGIEVDRGNGSANPAWGAGLHVPADTNVPRGRTRPITTGTPEPFVLSTSEANHYFNVGSTGAQGSRTQAVNPNTNINTPLANGGSGSRESWWLRSPGSDTTTGGGQTRRHARVGTTFGAIESSDPAGVFVSTGLRPALWIQTTPITISFDANGGSGAPANQARWANVAIELPTEVPTRKNHEFQGWATSQENANNGIVAHTAGSNKTFTTNTQLWAVWDPDYHTVTFDANDGLLGLIPPNILVQEGTVIGDAFPTEEPIRATYTFTGWETEDGEVVDEKFIVTGNVTAYAQWKPVNHKVTFLWNYAGASDNGIMETISVREGSPLAEPNEPTRAGYEFEGWVTDPAGEDAWNFETPVTEDLRLYARWNTPTVEWTVTFMDGDDVVDVQVVEHESLLVAPESPTRAGYEFEGWYYEHDEDASLFTRLLRAITQRRWDFENDRVTGYVTLYARWEPIMHTVMFDANDGLLGLVPPNIQVQEGTVIGDAFPTEEPIRATYTFTSWETEDGEVVDEKFIVTGNVTAYAQWKPVNHKVTFLWNYAGASDNGIMETISVREGSPLAEPNEPTRAGYEFEGWVTDPAGEDAWNFENNRVIEDVTLYARWERITTTPSPVPPPASTRRSPRLPQTGAVVGSLLLGGVLLASGVAIALKKKKKD